MTPRCPIRRHDHDLVRLSTLRQVGTETKAGLWECPTGRYRWFVLDGYALSDTTRMARPRWGWKVPTPTTP